VSPSSAASVRPIWVIPGEARALYLRGSVRMAELHWQPTHRGLPDRPERLGPARPSRPPRSELDELQRRHVCAHRRSRVAVRVEDS
jgi:hypothetical protein